MCPVNKGNFCRNGSHFFFTFVSIRPNFINMETINYQAKVNELLGHLSGYGYCAKHLQSFKREGIMGTEILIPLDRELIVWEALHLLPFSRKTNPII